MFYWEKGDVMKSAWSHGLVGVFIAAIVHGAAVYGQIAFEIEGQKTSMKDLIKAEEGTFFEIEKKKYELVEQIAKSRYLEAYWKKAAASSSKSVTEAQNEYFDKNAKVSEKEIKDTIEQFKDHPQLKSSSRTEQETKIKEYLSKRRKDEVLEEIVASAVASGKLKIVYPQPKEPVFQVEVQSTDPVRFGPELSDIKPFGCKGNDCAVTVVEYSEFQCPFCSRVLPTAQKLLGEYKGKARWIVRDYPLPFHNRARAAAVAARCALRQDKYWQMYSELFNNQSALSDDDLKGYAKKISLDIDKYNTCFKNSEEIEKVIDANYSSGEKLGVTGTPAFFINGRRMSGALPYEEFKRVFDEELKKSKKT